MTNRRVSGSRYPYVSDLLQLGEVSGQAVHPLPATGTGPLAQWGPSWPA